MLKFPGKKPLRALLRRLARPRTARDEDEALRALAAITGNVTIERFLALYNGGEEKRRRLDMGVGLATNAAIVGDLLASAANTEFVKQEAFKKAYAAAWGTTTRDLRWRFYVHTAMAHLGLSREGVFVEAGVQYGNSMFGLITYHPQIGTERRLYLFDTYQGAVPEQMNEAEHAAHSGNRFGSIYEKVVKRFAPFPNVRIVKGAVPGTLDQFTDEQVAYLHLDMNVAYPEVEALKFFWPKMSLGAPVLFDDYGFPRHHEQKHQLDALVKEWGRSIMLLPTGQGLLIK